MQSEWNARAKENAYHWVVSSKQQWDKDAYYAEGEKDIEKRVMPFFAERGISQEKYSVFSVLDIGCGTGRLCRALSKRFRSVTGIDISEEMLKHAKEDNADLANVRWVHGSGSDLSGIADASMDFVFSFIVFQHIPSKSVIRKYFQEVFRILKPGGLFKIQVRGIPGDAPGRVLWFHGFDNGFIALTLWRGMIPLLWFRKYDSVYGACFTQGELLSMADSIGFRELSTEKETEKYLWIEGAKGAEGAKVH